MLSIAGDRGTFKISESLLIIINYLISQLFHFLLGKNN